MLCLKALCRNVFVTASFQTSCRLQCCTRQMMGVPNLASVQGRDPTPSQPPITSTGSRSQKLTRWNSQQHLLAPQNRGRTTSPRASQNQSLGQAAGVGCKSRPKQVHSLNLQACCSQKACSGRNASSARLKARKMQRLTSVVASPTKGHAQQSKQRVWMRSSQEQPSQQMQHLTQSATMQGMRLLQCCRQMPHPAQGAAMQGRKL